MAKANIPSSALLVLASFMSGLSAAAVAQENEASIRSQVVGDRLFVNAADIADETGFELKVIGSSDQNSAADSASVRLVTFCRETPNAICIPVRLEDGDARYGKDAPGTQVAPKNDGLMIAADLITQALSVEIVVNEKQITVRKSEGNASSLPEQYGYHDRWPKGRGFRTGETVPDIPLVDMNGGEVRLSAFLGKRYILYCWASW